MLGHGLLKYMDSTLILTVYLTSVTFSVQHRKEKLVSYAEHKHKPKTHCMFSPGLISNRNEDKMITQVE